MKSLLAKLEALVDEAVLLVREERARRNAQPFLGARPDLYGPRGTEIHWDPTNWGGHGILDTPPVTCGGPQQPHIKVG